MTKIIEARKANVGKTGAKQIIKFENDNGIVITSITQGSYLTIKDNIKRYSEKEYLDLLNQVFKIEVNNEANIFINNLYSKFALKMEAA